MPSPPYCPAVERTTGYLQQGLHLAFCSSEASPGFTHQRAESPSKSRGGLQLGKFELDLVDERHFLADVSRLLPTIQPKSQFVDDSRPATFGAKSALRLQSVPSLRA
jgi:hypothetical protein